MQRPTSLDDVEQRDKRSRKCVTSNSIDRLIDVELNTAYFGEESDSEVEDFVFTERKRARFRQKFKGNLIDLDTISEQSSSPSQLQLNITDNQSADRTPIASPISRDSTPTAQLPSPSLEPIDARLTDQHDSGISHATSDQDIVSASLRPISRLDKCMEHSASVPGEQSFEGIANGYMSGVPDSTCSDDQSNSDIKGRLSRNGHLHAFYGSMRKTHSTNAMYKNGSRRDSFNSDIENMSVSDAELHSELTDISSKVSGISQKLQMLEEVHMTSDEQRNRLKVENAALLERMSALEDQLHSVEERWKEKYTDEKARSKDLQHRMEREKKLELESMGLKFQVLEKDYNQLQLERNKLSEENTQLKDRCDELRIRIDSMHIELQQANDEKKVLAREYDKLREKTEDEMASSSELVEDLKTQNEELRTHISRGRTQSIADRTAELETELSRLRDERHQLLSQNDDLSAQLLQASVEAGHSLLKDDLGTSLAAELHGKDKDELIQSLKEQEVVNQKLRIYIEGILLRVIEKHPDILEVGNKDI